MIFILKKIKNFQTVGGVGFSWVKLNGHIYLLSKKNKNKKDTCHNFKVICRSLENFFFSSIILQKDHWVFKRPNFPPEVGLVHMDYELTNIKKSQKSPRINLVKAKRVNSKAHIAAPHKRSRSTLITQTKSPPLDEPYKTSAFPNGREKTLSSHFSLLSIRTHQK